ncbi:AAEL006924-PA [Aedes aegypti]|uniref:AAEL006924-PA n=1 Tax=Aedes aegypti TaxID=7159 RepID=Q174E6_AEDAE|nr:AAEL006924-PA [Aedes aegypti]
MNYLLHRQRTPGKVIPVPDELKELMLEISREVLRSQPKNVIHFVADYLEAKLIRRENQVVADKVVDTVLDTSLDIITMLDEIGLNEEKAERAVRMIREAFQKHFKIRTSDENLRDAFREAEVLKRLVDECGFSESEALKAGKIIERAYKTYFLRNVYKYYHGPAVTSDWQDAAKHTLGIYAQSGASKEEMERAAVRIQTAYRGYFTRKRQELDRKAAVIQEAYRKHQEKLITTGILNQIIDDVIEPKFSAREEVMRIVDMVLREQIEFEQPETSKLNEAATKIQSAYRGRKIREKVMLGIDLTKEEDSKANREEMLKTINLTAQSTSSVANKDRKDTGEITKGDLIAMNNTVEGSTSPTTDAMDHLAQEVLEPPPKTSSHGSVTLTPSREKAAIQMQSLARGHLQRKKLSQTQNQQDK